MRKLCICTLLLLTLMACRKEQKHPYTFGIEASAKVDYKGQQTIVNVTATFDQDDIERIPEGRVLLIFSGTKDMSDCDTMFVDDFGFDGGETTFAIPVAQRPFEQSCWFFVELQAPLSQPLRSEVFVMPTMKIPDGAFVMHNGEFIRFAPGNLQYNPVTTEWRFAENQYDIIGEENSNISVSYDGFIDLFGYGTSGYRYEPYNNVLDTSEYAQDDITGTRYDWGIHGQISNGVGYSWRTPESSDWVYIYSDRLDAEQKRALGTVNGVRGMILLPDRWTLPEGCSFTADANRYSTNIYTVSDWQLMEDAGAVFLPAAGYRVATSVNGIAEGDASYHSSSWCEPGKTALGYDYCAQPVHFVFDENAVYAHAVYTGTDAYNAYGASVRLIRSVNK